MLFNIHQFAAVFTAAMTFFSEPACAQTSPPPCVRNYTVKSGDWCDKISAEQHSSTYQLANANIGLINSDCSNLAVDMVICLGREGQDCTDTAVVASGSSCSAIADAASITYEKLRTNNPNIDEDCTNIYPDEVLCVQA